MNRLFVLLAFLFLFSGGASGQDNFLTVKDDMGREVRISGVPKRIVSLAASNAEILFALGLGDKVVGVIDPTDYPREARKKVLVGSYRYPNIEKIVSLKPDLILSDAGVQKDTALKLDKLGYKVLMLWPKDLAQITNDIELVGRATGRQKAAYSLVLSMKRKLDKIKKESQAFFHGDWPVVYFELWNDPMMTAGAGSFINDLIEIAGGKNLAADIQNPYPVISAEVVISRNPEVILVGYKLEGTKVMTEFEARPGWKSLPAVRNKHIYADIPMDLYLRPGSRVVQGCEEIFKRLKASRSIKKSHTKVSPAGH